MKYRHLTLEQRYVIEVLYRKGHTFDEIGEMIGCDPTSVSREISRNSRNGTYSAQAAQALADSRRSAASSRERTFTTEVRNDVEAMLREEWSPEQITNRMRSEGRPSVSHERIYQHVWNDKEQGGELHRSLRQASRLRRKRYGKHSRQGPLPNRTMIDDRPAIVDTRSRIGDWEVDTVIGAHHQGAIITAVERRSRYLVTAVLPSPNAEAMRVELTAALRPHAHRVLTITVDNDRAFAQHARIARALKADIYFAHPYRSWERGTNENTNGLLRQYFPKGMEFKALTRRDVRRAENKLNHRPRKTLGWKTPHEIIFDTTTRFFP